MAPLASGRALDADRARAYRAARRHSAWVRSLKFVIPAGAFVAIGAVTASALYTPLSKFGDLSLGTLSLNGTKITMENPRLTGFRKDSRGYEVVAKSAQQDVRKPGLIELKDMRARMATDEAGSFAKLVSNAGLFDSAKEKLELNDDIHIVTNRGDEVLLRSASVDLKAGTVVSRQPVKVTTATGTIEAEGVQVSENGRTVTFAGRVRTEFRRLPDEPAVTSSSERKPAGAPAKVTQAETVVR